LRTLQFWLLLLAAFAMAAPLAAQNTGTPGPTVGNAVTSATSETAGNITGTVTDVNGDTLIGATVALQGPSLKEPLKVESDYNGFFQFKDVEPGTYRVAITAPNFDNWTSAEFVLNAGQYMILPSSQLHISAAQTTVNVQYTAEEVALEQVKVEETQRVWGIIPNFYVVYDPSPVPLTTKLKFHLALKTATDAVTIAGVGVLAGINQAGDTPGYGQGMQGYGKRFGAAAADGFSDIMIGGAILPSLLHQDPRYYYQGTGSTKSRLKHALSAGFICHGDNGRLQPNYSTIGGDLASAGLSNLYYPRADRGTGLMFQNFLISSGERALSGVVQEFILGKITSHAKSKN